MSGPTVVAPRATSRGASASTRCVDRAGRRRCALDDQALDEALCVGWIDGQVNRRDEGSYYQRFTPRTRRSAWSARNVAHIARLEAEGRLLPAGRAAVEAAQADGRWDRAYPGSATATVPDDFARALAENSAARAQFETLTSQNRYAFVYRLGAVKTPAARQRNIDTFVQMLARGELFHPQKGPRTGP